MGDIKIFLPLSLNVLTPKGTIRNTDTLKKTTTWSGLRLNKVINYKMTERIWAIRIGVSVTLKYDMARQFNILDLTELKDVKVYTDSGIELPVEDGEVLINDMQFQDLKGFIINI